MRIFIDADGCPVVEAAVAAAKRRKLGCTIVCDTAHVFNFDCAETVTVDQGADMADFKLVSLLSRGDIAVTQDYGLAAMCLAKGANCIDQNGRRYTDKNIETLLDMRFVSKKARAAGKHPKGPKKRLPEADAAFERELEKLINEQLLKEGAQ